MKTAWRIKAGPAETLENYSKADAELTLKFYRQWAYEEDRRTLEVVRTAIWCLFAAVVLFELLRP